MTSFNALPQRENTNRRFWLPSFQQFLLLVIPVLITAACNLPMATPVAPATPTQIPATNPPPATATPTDIPASPTATASPLPSETLTALPSDTPAPTSTPTSTFTPEIPSATPGILRAKVLERANCRYGPGGAYLYKYGLVAESNLQVIGRNDTNTWLWVQAIGGNNPCWVNAKSMEPKGDLAYIPVVDPRDVKLPMSPYYGPLTNVSAQRDGAKVVVSWSELVLRAGDSSEQFPYLLEVWVCKGGQQVFQAIGTYDTIWPVDDEPGCAEPSHGRVYGVEKHGYTRWVEIPWP